MLSLSLFAPIVRQVECDANPNCVSLLMVFFYGNICYAIFLLLRSEYGTDNAFFLSLNFLGIAGMDGVITWSVCAWALIGS